MKAYELIDTPEKWCQRYQAEKSGKPCLYYDDGAEKFCLLGAIWRKHSGSKTFSIDSDTDIKKVNGKLCVWKPAEWNDDPHRTQAEVYDLLKELDI